MKKHFIFLRETYEKIIYFFITILLSSTTLFAVEFTKEDLDLVRNACLAGDEFYFKTKANGDISIGELSGSGKFMLDKKSLTIIDVAPADKPKELDKIRNCIKEYLNISTPSTHKKDALQCIWINNHTNTTGNSCSSDVMVSEIILSNLFNGYISRLPCNVPTCLYPAKQQGPLLSPSGYLVVGVTVASYYD